MAVMREEIFGPIVPFQKVASEDEAVALANDSRLGLNAYVFTKDRAKGERLALRIEAGSVLVNDVLSNYGAVEAPFGGTKDSGFGRVHGEGELEEMCERRHVSLPRASRIPLPGADALWYPYTAKSFNWLKRAMSALFSRGGVVRRVSRLF
jgi:succinate-semialdehyde dehydrogenase/glutarate-semialdehyde dehydrogenase